MSSLMTVHTLGPQLIALLGLPKHCISFELRCAVGEFVTVKCEFHPEEAEGIDLVLADYELVPRETGPILQGMSYDAWVCHRAGVTHAAEAIGFDAWMRERTEAAHRAMMKHAQRGGIPYT